MHVGPSAPQPVPVIALTGHLGAGKTTVLNALLAAPGARLGVIVNDVGEINVDAAMVTGQVDDAASIAGSCLCCLPDSTPLDDALERLSRPRLALDAIVIEASGAAEPLALGRMIRFSSAERTRLAGVVEVVDAETCFETVDPGGDGPHPRPAPARYAAPSLVLVTKTDLLPARLAARRLEAITARVRERSEDAHVLAVARGGLDPTLLLDVARTEDPPDQLPLAALAREEHARHVHEHADAVTVHAHGPVEPSALADLLEDPPEGVFRLKGIVAVAGPRDRRRFALNLVGRRVHVATAPAGAQAEAEAESEHPEGLVAIGMHLDEAAVRARLVAALAPCEHPSAAGMRRLLRLKRLSA
ncbi:GTP-binding protein [Brachybacterium halotolerans subsp. kimchii]|uniref:CobW family GTP-binding protein n=1 Tax=Brachybacterium halotolerans TaxID=2795215 RepID=UPI001E32577F|nr:GTP-binding protein [Brachybacterium halotolerans]UEJ82036.1 GTP-binding protein [Brachybacterium halotolerans subsp. kimchii]